MLSQIDRAYIMLCSLSASDADSAITRWRDAAQTGLADYLSNGWEIAPDDHDLAATGVPSIKIGGVDIIPSSDLWAQIKADAVAQASPKKNDNDRNVCTAVIDGQLCGGSLQRAYVCPRCPLGKHGVVATLTCDVCGAVTAEMRQK